MRTKKNWHDALRGNFTRSSKSEGLYKIRAQNKLVQRLLSKTRTCGYIDGETSNSIGRLDVHCRQWCFFASDGIKFFSFSGKREHHEKHLPGNPNLERYRPFHRSGEGKPSGARHVLVSAVGGRLACGIISCTTVREFGRIPSTSIDPKFTEGEKTISCCTDNLVLLIAATQQRGTPSISHDPAKGTRHRSGRNQA